MICQEGDREESVLVAFLRDPRFSDLHWWTDKDTGELVTHCPTCGAEARHTEEGLMHFRFLHELWCPARVPVHEA
jgi:hypothetical protein